jgi:hypothetical protein
LTFNFIAYILYACQQEKQVNQNERICTKERQKDQAGPIREKRYYNDSSKERVDLGPFTFASGVHR